MLYFNPHLASRQLCYPWQLQLLLCNARLFCARCCVLLTQFPALLVLNGAEHTEAAVSASRQQAQALQEQQSQPQHSMGQHSTQRDSNAVLRGGKTCPERKCMLHAGTESAHKPDLRKPMNIVIKTLLLHVREGCAAEPSFGKIHTAP